MTATNDDAKLSSAATQETLDKLTAKAELLRHSKPREAVQVAYKALEILKNSPNSNRELDVNHILILAAYAMDSHLTVANTVYKMERLAFESGSAAQQVRALQDLVELVVVSRYIDNYRNILMNRYIEDFEQAAAQNDRLKMYAVVGVMHSHFGHYNLATRYYQSALSLTQPNEQPIAVHIHNNMSLNFIKAQKYAKAIEHAQFAQELGQKWQLRGISVNALINLATVYQQRKNQGKLESALAQIAAVKSDIIDDNYRFKYKMLKGNNSTSKSQYQQSLLTYHKALTLAQSLQNDIFIGDANFAIGKVHSAMRAFDKSLPYLVAAADIAERINYNPLQAEVNEYLNNIYTIEKRFELAHQAQGKHYRATIENIEERSNYSLYELQQRYKAKQQLKTIDSLKQEKLKLALEEQRRRVYILAAFSVLILVIVSLTYRQRLKREIEQQRAEHLAQQVERKNQIFAEVSHEIRMPLSILQLKIEALQHNLVEDVQQSYSSIGNKIGQIVHLVNDISILAQSDIAALALERETVNCQSFFSQSQAELGAIVEKQGLQWQAHIKLSDSAKISIDTSMFTQVLNNLISNALAYTRNPGTVKLTATTLAQQLILIVEDSAPTVEDSELNKIFNRLYRSEASNCNHTKGSGLGLAICKAIVERHQGQIDATSSAMGGLKVTITLPLVSTPD